MKLENDLIKLMPYDEDHIHFFAKWRRYYGDHFFTPIFPSISALNAGFANYLSKSMAGHAYWWVITKTEDAAEDPIGMVGLNEVDHKNGTAEIGQMFILEQHRGQGYMQNAIAMVLDLAFNELRLEAVCLWTYPFNKEARESYEKAGFVETGFKPNSFYRKGQRWDLLLMTITRGQHAGTETEKTKKTKA